MVESRVERRLAAILAADIAGYSRLMGSDEEGTLASIKACRREIIDPKLSEHRGRIVKTTGRRRSRRVCERGRRNSLRHGNPTLNGSSTIRMFPRTVASNFALASTSATSSVDEGDIYGDGVNIAARIEALAQPGTICLSENAYRQVTGKLALEISDMGEQQLKNIAQPVRVYRLIPDGALRRTTAATLPLPDKPSIAVLPFQNMSGDPEQDYFADGIVEEIIAALSRFRELFVIARNSTFTYKGRAVDVKQVGRELGVRYVLEGSVRKAASRVRITSQLIDAISGVHLWADRIDGTVDDIFVLQDQVTENVVGAIAPKIAQAEIERAKPKSTERLDAYDSYLRAMMYFNRWTRESISEALRLLYRAIELDPGFASAYGLAGWCYVRRRLSGWMEEPIYEMAELERLARKASELANDDAVPLYSAGWALVQTNSDAQAGAAMIDRALTLNPNITAAWLVGGWTKIYLGELNKAIGYFERAIRLNPLDPLIARMQTGIAAAQFLAGQYQEAAVSAENGLRQHPNDLPLLRVAAASYALAGEMMDAQRHMGRIRHLDPMLRLSRVTALAPCRRPDDVSRYVEGMRRAGLPE